MSRMMIYINYPLSSQLTKFVTVTLTFVTVSYIVSYVRNQPESYTLTSLSTSDIESEDDIVEDLLIELLGDRSPCSGSGSLDGTVKDDAPA
jgi:hypothetical protein